MGNILFALDKKTNDWQTVGILPIPPRYNLADYKQKKVYCQDHQAWEKIAGITGQMDENRQNKKIQGFILACGHIAYPPFVPNYGIVPYGYEVKVNDKLGNALDLTVTSMIYSEKRKIKTDRTFSFNLDNGKCHCSDMSFSYDEESAVIPSEVASYSLKHMGIYYRGLFGFVPTVTSSSEVENFTVMTGYTMYPFNINFIELRKIAGMQAFPIDRKDPQSTNKMYDYLHIKPSKVLRKTYNEFPCAPIIYKFLVQLGFKDPNIINKELKNKVFLGFLKIYWGNYIEEADNLDYNGQPALRFFCEESRKLNKEHTVMAALKTCCETGLLAKEQNFSLLMDTLQQFMGHFDRINEGIRREILHDGVTTRTHENLINYFASTQQAINAALREEPFPYTAGDLSLEWIYGWFKKPVEGKDDKGETVIVEDGIPELMFYLPKNENELIDYGKRMHNCVGWGFYTERVRARNVNIVSVFYRNEPYLCIELSINKLGTYENRKIVQALGVCNKKMTDPQKNLVREWATIKKIDTNGWC